jgi:cytochrome c biogenesis protein CcdA
MNLRALLIFVICGILIMGTGAIVGWEVSWLIGLGIGVVIVVAIDFIVEKIIRKMDHDRRS